VPRAMWSGAISFGLVNIPVKLYKATASSSGKQISFHQIHKTCGTRIRHIRWCPQDEVEVPWDEVVKGYEVEKGKYVEVSDEELDAILPEENYAAIAIESFVALDEVDPIFYDRAYYVAPDGSPKAYALLHQVLSSTGRVALARVLLRTRSHLAVVRVLADHFLLETMFYAAEIVDVSEVPGVPKGKAAHVDKRQIDVAHKLVESMTSEWDPERYKDDYSAEVKKIIERKIKGGEVVESPVVPTPEGGKVVDLYDALKRSVEATKLRPVAPPSSRRRIKSAVRRRAGAKRGSRSRHG
jgi:DNA end-binding protein Ku